MYVYTYLDYWQNIYKLNVITCITYYDLHDSHTMYVWNVHLIEIISEDCMQWKCKHTLDNFAGIFSSLHLFYKFKYTGKILGKSGFWTSFFNKIIFIIWRVSEYQWIPLFSFWGCFCFQYYCKTLSFVWKILITCL